MRIEKYLDAVIERHSLKNDSALAELLGVAQSAVSHYRTGRRSMDNETCLKIAQALEMADPLPVIMSADMDRAERAGQHSLWEVFSKRMPTHAASASLAVIAAAIGGSVTKFVTSPSLQASIDAVLRAKDSILC
ncbi:helix-turn-helix domain-containing protein [Cupriavidus campinensis]|uniref:Helix-turn-helix domain-containing protein n=1 Tax=Cupriavidus campinensis TaxID=151783 RepID=A0AAE9L689_9BURK|nr:helix-turn-helix domain-containing protein [Cupriavidus campinensis]URF08055.1 helix-turn-helix domain-containing protein [Cupriavidus campinensis]